MAIDMRKELKHLVFDEKEKDILIFRHLTETKCQCVQQPETIYCEKIRAKVPNPNYRTVADPSCPNCEGHGWIFNEYLVDCKYNYTPTLVAHDQDFNYGSTNSNTISIYLPFTDITKLVRSSDAVFMLQTDDSGKPISPFIRRRKWIITDVYELHADNNKLEFIKAFAKPAVV